MGSLKKYFQRNECYYRENFTNKVANIDEMLLKEPHSGRYSMEIIRWK